MIIHVLYILLILTIIVPIGIFYLGEKKKNRFKSMLIVNIVSFFGVLIFTIIFMFTNVTFANETIVVSNNVQSMAFLAAALSTGLCTIGTGIATGQAASAALGALSENEELMGKALIFVALAEGIAIYGLLISFTILGRV